MIKEAERWRLVSVAHGLQAITDWLKSPTIFDPMDSHRFSIRSEDPQHAMVYSVIRIELTEKRDYNPVHWQIEKIGCRPSSTIERMGRLALPSKVSLQEGKFFEQLVCENNIGIDIGNQLKQQQDYSWWVGRGEWAPFSLLVPKKILWKS